MPVRPLPFKMKHSTAWQKQISVGHAEQNQKCMEPVFALAAPCTLAVPCALAMPLSCRLPQTFLHPETDYISDDQVPYDSRPSICSWHKLSAVWCICLLSQVYLCCLAVAFHQSTDWAESVDNDTVPLGGVASGILTVLYNLTAELAFTMNACKAAQQLSMMARKKAKALVGPTQGERHAAVSGGHEGTAYWLGQRARSNRAQHLKLQLGECISTCKGRKACRCYGAIRVLLLTCQS